MELARTDAARRRYRSLHTSRKGESVVFERKVPVFFLQLACVAAPCSRAETWLVDGPWVNAWPYFFIWAARRGLRSYSSKRVIFDHFGAFRQQRSKILSSRTSGIVVGWGCNSNAFCISYPVVCPSAVNHEAIAVSSSMNV